VLEPVRWRGNDPMTLQPIIDLFLDIWISPDGSFVVLDEDELTDAVQAGNISMQRASEARSVLATLIKGAESGSFPPRIVKDFQLRAGE
jgi:predicted RNA-binding protein associated with RNAse of E/G family